VDVLRAEVPAAKRKDALSALLDAIDEGQRLVPALAAWLGCRAALARHLLSGGVQVPRQAWSGEAEPLRLVVPALESVAPEKWPRTHRAWAQLIAAANRLHGAYRPLSQEAQTCVALTLSHLLKRGDSESWNTTLVGQESLARSLRTLGARSPEVYQAAASLSAGALDRLLNEVEEAKRSFLLGLPVGSGRFPQPFRDLARSARCGQAKLRVVAPDSLRACVAWGSRVGNCLSNPQIASAYFSRGKLVLCLSEGAAPIATVAVAAVPGSRPTDFRIVELQEYAEPLSEQALQLLACAISRMEEVLDSMYGSEGAAAVESWFVIARNHVEGWLAKGQSAGLEVLREWAMSVVERSH
jgi:hypothetical protein